MTTLETRLSECLKVVTTDLSNMLMEGVMKNMKPFFEKVSSETGMEVLRLEALFTETQQTLQLPEKTVSTAPQKSTRKSSGKKATPVGPEVECDFIMTARSAKAGQPCGAKVTQEGCTRCRRHLKSKTDDEKKPATKSAGTKSTATKSAATKSSATTESKGTKKTKKSVDPPVIKDAVETTEPVVEAEETINTNKWGYYMDPENNFVFADASVVCGRQNMETGEIEELTEDEIKICEFQEFEYDKNAEPAKAPTEDEEE